MKRIEKICLIDTIGETLQKKMTFSEIYGYLQDFGIPTDHEPSYPSKRVYVKEVLQNISDQVILSIAEELGLTLPTDASTAKLTDDSIWDAGHFRLFISHLASFKETIGKLKRELSQYGISGFVAHDDIQPTKEWQVEIEKALLSMEALCAVLMPGFHESKWTDQEIGAAIGRKVLIIPIRRGLDPYGFIEKYQGFQANGKNIGEVAESIFLALSSHEKTRGIFIDKLVELFLGANSGDEGFQRLQSLLKVKPFPLEKVGYISSKIVQNQNLNDNRIIQSLNQILVEKGYRAITTNDFRFTQSIEEDDLPF